MVGMPESGKTTYLVSLCRQVSMGSAYTILRMREEDIPTGLPNIENLIGNLLEGKEVGRTLGKTQYDIKIPLIDEADNEIELTIPDLSGEIFRDFIHDRRLLKEIADKLIQADEILFFINTNTMIKQEYLSLTKKSAMKIIEEKNPELKEITPNEETFLEAVNDKSNQSEIVDLLQGILFITKGKVKIKFIITAWDKVEKEDEEKEILPEIYIKRELPLLYQYVKTNTDKFGYQIWGVSAQGGDFGNEQEKNQILENGLDKYIKVVDFNGQISGDLTIILHG